MTKRYRNILGWSVAALLVGALAFVAAGCGGGGEKAATSTGPALPTSVGQGEGKLSLVAWEGYTQPDWVKPFEKQTGCKVTAKYAGSSDEMVTLMRQGGSQYDMVSASGDASLRLIKGGNVEPVNPALIPDFKNFIEALKSPPHNTVDGKHYGISLQWGPNTLLYNTANVTPAPTSWGVIYTPKYKGKITVPDNPIQIADAALYLSKTQAGSRHHGPVRAEPEAVRRGRGPDEAAAPAAEEVLGAGVGRDRPVQERRRRRSGRHGRTRRTRSRPTKCRSRT